jgi:multidrug resistance protein, MATE family
MVAAMRRDLAPIAAEIRATLTIAAPLAGANLAQMAMQVINIVMVGHLGAISLAAAGLGASIYGTLLMICQGVLTAVAPLAAHAFGADDHHAAGRLAGAGLILAGCLAAPVFALLTATPHLLARLGYAPALVIDIGRFLDAIRWGAPAFLGLAVLRFLLIAAFRARIVMIVPLTAVPLYGGLAWALIFGHLGAPALGVVGAGCATATMQWLMLGALAAYLLLTRRRIPVLLAARFWRDISRIMRLGVPIGAQRGLEVGLFVTIGVMMGVFGAAALGAHQLVFNVAGVSFMIPLGLAQAATVRVAFQLGAGAPAAAQRAGFVALSLGALFMAGSAVVLWTQPRALAGLYLDLADPANRDLLAIAVHLFMIAAIFQVFDGAQVIAGGALRGYRDTAVPMLLAAIGYWAVGFAGGWLIAFPLGFGAIGLWIGLALGLAVVAASLTLRLRWQARAHLAAVPALAPAPAAAMAPP